MKKLLISVLMVLGLISSSFALNLSFGAKGMLGANVGTNMDSIAADLVKAKTTVNFLYAGGIYTDLSIFGPLGVQVGANIGKNKVTTNDSDGKVVEEYEELLLDVPVMIWADFKLGPIGLGLGIGPNISFGLGADYSFAGIEAEADKLEMNKAVWGLAAGANAKIYFNKHVALVGGANYVLDIQKKEITFKDSMAEGFMEFNRSALYGDLGLELKLF